MSDAVTDHACRIAVPEGVARGTRAMEDAPGGADGDGRWPPHCALIGRLAVAARGTGIRGAWLREAIMPRDGDFFRTPRRVGRSIKIGLFAAAYAVLVGIDAAGLWLTYSLVVKFSVLPW